MSMVQGKLVQQVPNSEDNEAKSAGHAAWLDSRWLSNGAIGEFIFVHTVLDTVQHKIII